jgi:hypothetical protein
MGENLVLVQFPHPGPEHKPERGSDVMGWHRRDGPHCRKFLKSLGRWRDATGQEHSGELTFWGEWEPQSLIIHRWPDAAKGAPRFLHEPFWCVPGDDRWLYNTDPFVFGECFLYSNCRQPHFETLRELAPGSVILFGSNLGGAFVLDTVFVVASGVGYSWAKRAGISDVNEPFRRIVLDPLFTSQEDRSRTFRLYRGATPEVPWNGMFSFVPCRPASGDAARFARPVIHLPGLVTPNLAMRAKFNPLDVGALERAWRSVIEQIHAQGLFLGYGMPVPREEPDWERGRSQARPDPEGGEPPEGCSPRKLRGC